MTTKAERDVQYAMAKRRFGAAKPKDAKPASKPTVKPTGSLKGGGRIGIQFTKKI